MKYSERIAQSEEQKVSSSLEFEVRSAKLQIESAILNKERSLSDVERAVEQAKGRIPFDVKAVLDQVDKSDIIKRDIKNLKALLKELF